MTGRASVHVEWILHARSPSLALLLAHVTVHIFKIGVVFLCVYSWWEPALTSSVWCPSWSLSSFLSWSSFFPSSSNFSLRCCLPLLRQSPKRHVFMYTQTHTPCRLHDPMTGFIWLCNYSDMAVAAVLSTSGFVGSWLYLIQAIYFGSYINTVPKPAKSFAKE